MGDVYHFDAKDERRKKWKRRLKRRKAKAEEKHSGTKMKPYDRDKDRRSIDDD